MNPTATARIRSGDTQLFSEQLTGPDEAAFLIAAGRFAAAEQLLRMSIDHGAPQAQRLALMLQELQGGGPDAPAQAEAGGHAGALFLAGTLGERPDELADLVRFAHARKTLCIDMAGVRHIPFSFLPAFEAALRNLAALGKRIIVANLSETHATLLESLEAQRHTVLMRRRHGGAESAGSLAAAA